MAMILRGKTLLNYISCYLQRQITILESKVVTITGLNDNQPSFAFDIHQTDIQNNSNKNDSSILDSIFGDGIVWGVPTCRRSLEKRMSRRLASNKVYRLKGNIIVCPVCYNYHEAHTICGHCYAKVKAETLAMQEAIQKELKYDPVDKEIAIVYKGGAKPENEGKRIVEIDREPPAWFSKNLLTKGYMPIDVKSNSEVGQPNSDIKIIE